MEGVDRNNLDALAIKAQEPLQKEELHISTLPLSGLFTLAPRAHEKIFTDTKARLPIIHQGGYLGTLFKPSARGFRTFQALPAEMSAVGEGGSCLNTAPTSIPYPPQGRRQLPRRTERTANY